MGFLYFAAVYAALGSPDWHTRERAEREAVRLVTLSPRLYGSRLAAWAPDATRPEIAARSGRAVRVYRRWRADSYTPQSVPVWPICDCYPRRVFPGVDVRDRDAVLAGLPAADYGPYVAADAGPTWHRWRRPTERMARRLIYQGTPPEEVDHLLLRMWRLELAAGSDCRRRAELESWVGRPWSGGYPSPREGSSESPFTIEDPLMYSRLLAALTLLPIAADPPVNVELPPATPAWVDLAVPVGAVKLTAKNAKPASWLLVDGAGATLAEQDGAARLFTAQPTVARVVMYQDGAGFLLLRVTAGQPKPDVLPPPKPVDPPAPKPVDPPAPKPADEFTAKVRAAYAASTEPDKANTRQDLIALFTVAQKFAANPTVMGTGDLIAKLSQASDDFVGAGKLDAVRQIFADELQKAYPDDVPLDDAKRKAIAALFAKFAAALAP